VWPAKLRMLNPKGAGKGKVSILKTIDPTCKVWVGGLAEGISWKDLETHFNSVGKTRWAEIMPKGTACIAYRTSMEATTAIASLNGTMIGGQAIQVDKWEGKTKSVPAPLGQLGGGIGAMRQLPPSAMGSKYAQGTPWKPVLQSQFQKPATWTTFSRDQGYKGFGKGRGKGKGKNPLKSIDAECKVWVGDIPATVTWKELEAHFNQAGKTRWVEVMPKGTGCIAYHSPEDAQNALSMLTGSDLGGQIITVDTWQKAPVGGMVGGMGVPGMVNGGEMAFGGEMATA